MAFATPRRAPVLMWGVALVLGIGILLAYALPVVRVPGTSGDYFDDPAPGYSVHLSDVNAVMHIEGAGWILDLAKAGVVAALVAGFAFRTDESQTQAIVISAGSLLGLLLPIWVHGHLDGASFGIGLWLFSLACLAAAVWPWLAPGFDDALNPVYVPSATSFSPSTSLGSTGAGSAMPSIAMSIPTTFVVSPRIGGSGATARAIARGFKPGQPVTIDWLDQMGTPATLIETTASPSGEIDVQFTTPADQPPGDYRIRAQSSMGVRWTTTYRVM